MKDKFTIDTLRERKHNDAMDALVYGEYIMAGMRDGIYNTDVSVTTEYVKSIMHTPDEIDTLVWNKKHPAIPNITINREELTDGVKYSFHQEPFEMRVPDLLSDWSDIGSFGDWSKSIRNYCDNQYLHYMLDDIIAMERANKIMKKEKQTNMKIIDERGELLVPFKDVPVGSIFESSISGFVYWKIMDVEVSRRDMNGFVAANCVNVESNEPVKYKDNDMVIILKNSKLTLNR